MTHDQLIETVTDIEHAALAEMLATNDTMTADDHLSLAVLLDEAVTRHLAQAETLEVQP